MDNYEQKYKETLEMARKAYYSPETPYVAKAWLLTMFPTIAENEDKDETMKKTIMHVLYENYTDAAVIEEVEIAEIVAWLEKQGEQHPYVDVNKMVDEFAHTEVKGYGVPSMIEVDAYRRGIEDALEKQCERNFDYEHADIPQKDFAPIEPKFKVGDWLQYRYAEPFLVEEIIEQGYCNGNSCLPFEWEDEIHLWTIQDAKDGDVLVDVYGNIGIFDKCYDFDWMSSCSLGKYGGFQHFKVEHENEKTYPASKEQHDLFFSKIKEEGLEWDSENKELKRNL